MNIHHTTENNIKVYGQSIMGVFDPKGSNAFFYTIGNMAQGLPELLLIGSFPPAFSMEILNAIGAHMRTIGGPLEDGMLDLDYTFPFKVRKCGDAAKSEYTIQAGQFFQREDYDVFQIMICDKNGKYPGDEGVTPVFDVAQP